MSLITPNQLRVNDPYQIKLYNFNTTDSKLYLSRAVNKLLDVVGNDIITDGLDILEVTHTDTSVTIRVSPGAAIVDNTLIEFKQEETLTIDDDPDYLDTGHFVLTINYQYLQTPEPAICRLKFSWVSEDGNTILPHGWDLNRDRVVIAILDFTKDGSGNITDVQISPTRKITILGKEYFHGFNVDSIAMRKVLKALFASDNNFQLDQANNGPILRNDSGALHLRLFDDSGFADFYAGNIHASGGITAGGDMTIDGNLTVTGSLTGLADGASVQFDAETLILNADMQPLNNPVGIEVARPDGNKFLKWNETNSYWDLEDNLNVRGNLYVQGTTTTVNSEVLSIADNIITLNSNFTTGTPTEDAGIEVLRGDSPTVTLKWSETNQDWYVTKENPGSYGGPGTVAGPFKIWHQGNMGDGSGLDADLLDGLHQSDFIRSNVDDTVTANTTWNNTKRIYFGTAKSYELYYDNAASKLNLKSRANNLVFAITGRSANTNKTIAEFTGNEAKFYYNNTLAFSTTSRGITFSDNFPGIYKNTSLTVETPDTIYFKINNFEKARVDSNGLTVTDKLSSDSDLFIRSGASSSVNIGIGNTDYISLDDTYTTFRNSLKVDTDVNIHEIEFTTNPKVYICSNNTKDNLTIANNVYIKGPNALKYIDPSIRNSSYFFVNPDSIGAICSSGNGVAGSPRSTFRVSSNGSIMLDSYKVNIYSPSIFTSEDAILYFSEEGDSTYSYIRCDSYYGIFHLVSGATPGNVIDGNAALQLNRLILDGTMSLKRPASNAFAISSNGTEVLKIEFLTNEAYFTTNSDAYRFNKPLYATNIIGVGSNSSHATYLTSTDIYENNQKLYDKYVSRTGYTTAEELHVNRLLVHEGNQGSEDKWDLVIDRVNEQTQILSHIPNSKIVIGAADSSGDSYRGVIVYHDRVHLCNSTWPVLTTVGGGIAIGTTADYSVDPNLPTIKCSGYPNYSFRFDSNYNGGIFEFFGKDSSGTQKLVFKLDADKSHFYYNNTKVAETSDYGLKFIKTSGDQILFDNGDARISIHDGCGNFHIKHGFYTTRDSSGAYVNQYLKTNSGAADIVFNSDNVDGSVEIRTATKSSNAGDTISWAGTYNFGTSEFKITNANLNLNYKELIFGKSDNNNIEHVWFDDTTNTYHFVADAPLRYSGNARIGVAQVVFPGTSNNDLILEKSINNTLSINSPFANTIIGCKDSSYSYFNTTAASGFYFENDVHIQESIVFDTNLKIEQPGNENLIALVTPSGTTKIGCANPSYTHFYTDSTNGFYFAKAVHVNGDIKVYNKSTYLDFETGNIFENGSKLEDKYVRRVNHNGVSTLTSDTSGNTTGSIRAPQGGILPYANETGNIGSSTERFNEIRSKKIYADEIYEYGKRVNALYEENHNVSGTSPTSVFTFPANKHRTAEIIIQCTYGTQYHSTKVFLVHDGTNVYLTEYATIFTGSELFTVDADITSGNVNVKVTNTSSAGRTYKISAQVIDV